EVDPFVHHIDPVGQSLLSEPPEHGAAPGERLLAARDEPARHAVDDAGVEIVVTHELLDVQRHLVAHVAEALGDLRLDVAREHIVLVSGEEGELVAHAPEKGEGGVRQAILAPRDEPLLEEIAQGARAELARGEPHGGVEIAQPARRLLHVGLAHVRGAAELPVALVALGQRRLQELTEVLAVHVLREDLAEALEEPAVSDDVARLLHGGARGEVGARHRHAIGQAPHRVADGETQVPQRVEQSLRDALDVRPHVAVVDDHEIQVGERSQLAAPVSAEGHQHDGRRGGAFLLRVVHRQAEERGEESVHEGRVGLDGLLPRGATQMRGLRKSMFCERCWRRSSSLSRRRRSARPAAVPSKPRSACASTRLTWRNKSADMRKPYMAWARYVKRGADLGGAIEYPSMKRIWREALSAVTPYEAGKSLEA